MLSIIGVKFMDIALKLNIIKKIESNIALEEVMPNIKMNFLFRYLNAIIYPITFLLSENYFNL
ncbi:hypothetical protein [Halarcobacter ebronensis]|nr:hypothetical protein [Halarcobacter ebronensis]